jgi:hypothetical protein
MRERLFWRAKYISVYAVKDLTMGSVVLKEYGLIGMRLKNSCMYFG